MSVVLGVLTSDPNLLRCELRRLEGVVSLSAEVHANAVGVGTYAQEDVLLQRFAGGAELSPRALSPRHESEALLYHAERLPVGCSLEENTQPFRFRRWLFAHQGRLPGFERMRAPLLEELPDFLRRQVRGEAGGELAFAVFLKHLREAGRLEGDGKGAREAARPLRTTVHELEAMAQRTGAGRLPALNLVATNGFILVAIRWGEAPLFYTRLEGSERCEECGLGPATPDTQPGVSAHRRRRTVVVASHLKRAAGWVELPHGTALAVGDDLQVHHVSA